MVKPTSFLVRMLTKAAGMPVGKGGSYDWNALVKEAGLCVTSIHEDLGTIRREPETVAKEAEAFGTKYVVITGMYRFDYALSLIHILSGISSIGLSVSNIKTSAITVGRVLSSS